MIKGDWSSDVCSSDLKPDAAFFRNANQHIDKAESPAAVSAPDPFYHGGFGKNSAPVAHERKITLICPGRNCNCRKIRREIIFLAKIAKVAE
jgi:hypothetical protein